jgi:hypothetical protein
MPKKTVVSDTTTIHVPGPHFGPPLFVDVKAIPPGNPVEIDAAEADRLIAAGVAREIKAADTSGVAQ